MKTLLAFAAIALMASPAFAQQAHHNSPPSIPHTQGLAGAVATDQAWILVIEAKITSGQVDNGKGHPLTTALAKKEAKLAADQAALAAH